LEVGNFIMIEIITKEEYLSYPKSFNKIKIELGQRYVLNEDRENVANDNYNGFAPVYEIVEINNHKIPPYKIERKIVKIIIL